MADDKNTEKTEELDAKDEHKQHHAKKDAEEPEEVKEEAETNDASAVSPKSKLQQFFGWYTAHKKLAIPASVVLFLVVFFAIPFTRYSTLGLFLKQDFSILVVDSRNGKPVSSAQVNLGGKTASTDGEGKVVLRVPVGERQLTITKTYYNSANQEIVVPVKKPSAPLSVKLEATGNPIPITVLNSISRKPLAGVALSAGSSLAKTDDKGQAVLVVPVGVEQIAGAMSADGYNKTDIVIKPTTTEDEANTFKLTPTGKIYFLSNQSGKIDVVKSDLDGQNRQTILAGTGKESKEETVLLATRDWKYLALQSKRDGGDSPKLFLINTADDSLTTMDEGDATFTLAGWEGHNFIYVVNRTKVQEWEPKKQALKAFNADDKKLKTLDQTTAEGSNSYDYKREYIGTVYVIQGKPVYVKLWYGNSYNLTGKQASLNSVKVDGSDKQVVRAFDTAGDLQVQPYAPDELYIKAADKFFEYDAGKLTSLSNMDSETFYNGEYTTFLLSPSGDQTFWSTVRDGKKVFFTGKANGDDEKRVATLGTDYQTYGWLTDEYLLVSKKGSELLIMHAAGVEKEDQLLKITDYYKPFYNYIGYGGGYGGL